MRTKSYNKKKLLSLVMLPILANSFATQAVQAGITNNPPTTGDTVVISGTGNTTPVDADIYNATDVSVQLEAGAELTVDGSSYPYYSAIYLLDDSSVVLDVGAQVTMSSGVWSSGVYVYNDSSTDSETNIDLSAGSSITAQDASFATGVDLYTKYAEGTTFDITLDGASIEASGEYFAAGISLDEYDSGYFEQTELTIELSDSSITATNYNAAGGLTPHSGAAFGVVVETDTFWDPDDYEAPAVSIDLYDSSISASSNLGYATGVLFDNYVEGGSLDLVLDKGSSIDVTATNLYDYDSHTTTAYAGGVVMLDVEDMSIDLEESSINVSAVASNNYNAVSLATGIYSYGFLNEQLDVTLREGSSMTVSSSAVNAGSAYAMADGVDLYTVFAEGGISVELNTGSSIDVQAHSSLAYNAASLAGGIEAQTLAEEGGEVEVLLDLGSSVTVLANSATVGPNAMAAATGIFASTSYDDVDVTIDNGSSVDATAVATSGFMTSSSYEPGAPYGSAAAISLGINTTPINFDESLLGILEGEPTALAPSMSPSLESTITLYNSAVSSTATAAAVDSAVAAAVGTANFAYESGGTSLIDSSVSATATVVTNSIGLEEPMLPISGALAAGVLDIGGTVDLSSDGLGGNEVTVDAAHTAYNSAALAVALGIENLAMMEDGQARVDAEYATIDVSATAVGDTYADAMARGVEAMAGLDGLLAGPEAAATVFSAPGDATVTLNSATVSVDATASSYLDSAYAEGSGVSAFTQYGDATISLLDTDVDVYTSATAYNSATPWPNALAASTGLSAYSYYNATVVLDGGSVVADASAQSVEDRAIASATAVEAFAGEGAVTVESSADITASADASGEKYAGAGASAIRVSGPDADGVVTVDDAVLNVDAYAVVTGSEAEASASVRIPVSTSSAFAMAEGVAVSVGWSYPAYNSATVTLSNTTLDIDATAVYAEVEEPEVSASPAIWGRATARASGITALAPHNSAVLLTDADLSIMADVTAASDAEGSASILGVWSGGEYGTAEVTMTNVNAVMNAATLASNDASAEVTGVAATSDFDMASVTLNSSTLDIDASAVSSGDSAEAGATGIDVISFESTGYFDYVGYIPGPYYYGYPVYEYSGDMYGASAFVNLDHSALSVEATADGASVAIAEADGIITFSAEAPYVSLADSTLDVDAHSMAEGFSLAMASGIESYVPLPYGTGDVLPDGAMVLPEATITLNSATVTVDATAYSIDAVANAEASGITLEQYQYMTAPEGGYAFPIYWVPLQGSSELTVSLEDSSLDVSANASAETAAEGYAVGIVVDTYDSVGISLDTSRVTAYAEVSSSAEGAIAESRGIETWTNSHALFDMYDSSVTSSASADGYDDGDADAEGVDLWAGETATVTLENSTVAVLADADSDMDAERSYYGYFYYLTSADADADVVDLDSTYGLSTTLDNVNLVGQAFADNVYGRSFADVDTLDVDSSRSSVTLDIFNSEGIYGYAKATSVYNSARADVDLVDPSARTDFGAVTLDVESSAFSAMAIADAALNATADVEAFDVDSSGHFVVTMNSATLNASASASSGYAEGIARADGILADSSQGSYGGSSLIVSESILSVSAMAEAANEAEGFAYGVDLRGAEGVDVSLDSATVNTVAEADSSGGEAVAVAGGLYAETGSQWGVSTMATLLDSTVTATADAYGYSEANADALGAFFGAEGAATVSLNTASIDAVATATSTNDFDDMYAKQMLMHSYGAEAFAIGLEAYSDGGGGEEVSVTLTDSTVTADAYAYSMSAEGSALAVAYGMIAGTDSNYNVSILLDNSQVSAVAEAVGDHSDAEAVGMMVNSYWTSADDVTIDLINSDVSAEAIAGHNEFAFGILVGPVNYNAVINIDENSSVTGTWAIDSWENTTVNNDGLIDGRVYVEDFNNSGTAVLRASVSSESEVLYDPEDVTGEHYAAYTDGSSFFTGTNSAYMAEGTIMQIYLEDGLTFDQQGDVVQLYMVEAGSGAGYSDWYANYGANVTVEQYGYDSPILTLEYSETYSTDQNFIVDATLLTRDESGISKNADNAVGAAATDGRLDFNSDPEEWVPDVSGVAAGVNRDLMKANVYNIQARTGVLEGMASGDEPADQGLWINFLYTDSEKDKDGLIDGYEAETAGVIVGYDRQVTPAFALGLAYTYATTDAETDIGNEDFDLDESLLSLYGNYETNSWFGEGQLSYGWGEVDGERQAADLYKFDYDTDVLYARVMAGKHYYCPESNWVLSPFGSIDYAKIEMDSYTEEGGAMALEVDPDDFDSMNLGAGIKVENRGATLTPEFKLIAYYDVIGDEIETSSKFVGGTTSFTSTGDEADRFSWDVGAALTFGKADSPLTFKVGYDLVGSEDFTSHNFNGKLRYEF